MKFDRAGARLTSVATALLGLIAGVIAALLGAGRAAPLIGWDVLALAFCVLVLPTIWSLNAQETRTHAVREDPGRTFADLALLGASLASLIAVGLILFEAGRDDGDIKYVEVGFALASIFVSWTLIHTVFALKYARLYYGDQPGGIDFNEEEPPQYTDFAYLAFTIGMTFQVSDTDLQTKEIRRTALRHALLSFPLGALIIATAINLVAGLAK